jgi:flagellar secretion chaperone FliS
MFASSHRAIKAYAEIGVETGVAAANPHKLILMLFEGAMLAVASAKMHMQRKEIAKRGEAISKALMIIESGLKASLDLKAGGQMAERLCALYDYMLGRLLYANIHERPEALDEVSHLLAELNSAWAAIGTSPAAVAGPGNGSSKP